jgi:putative flavoprotein involved in K+ transport
VSNGRVHFANDLTDSVAFGDARYLDIRRLLRDSLGDALPEMSDPPPFEAKAASEVDLDGFGGVVFTCGFRPDYGGWVKFPVFDWAGVAP